MKNPILTIFRKEVLENLRDRKTVMNALILGPVIGPLLFAIIMSTVLTRELGRAEKPLDLPVVGAERAPNLVAFLATRNLKIEPAPKDPEAAIRDQDEEIVLRIGKDFGEDWAAGKPAEVEMLFDSSRQDTGAATQRVVDALKAYRRQVSALRLVARGISPLLTHPRAVVERDQASEVARGAQFLMFLPYMLIIGAFMGGMYLAIDTTAGERERQSLEPLLATPVPRGQIMLGKLAATSAFAIASLLLTLIAFALLLPQLPLTKLGLKFNFGPVVFLQMLAALGPVVLLASSLQTLTARAQELATLGYDLEPFGEGTLKVSGVPALLGTEDAAKALQALADDLEGLDRGAHLQDALQHIAATTACHAAVKANYPLTYEKMTHILDELRATAYSTVCPHGRPVMLRLTRREIEKNFDRI